MANDVNANIRVNLDTSQALAGLQSLQSRISTFNQSVIQSNAQAVAAQRNLLNNFQAQVGASRQFSTSITNVETSVGRLQTAIDKNRLSMGQYFRYGVASSKNFSKVFRQENAEITRLATERVQKLQTQYVALGQAHGGMTKAMAVRPLQMFNADSAIAIQRSQIFNKLLHDGSTSLVNWGKNTQWAGRQLMVGFTVPLTIFGGIAAKTFMELEEQAIAFRKVYGDIFTSEAEVEQNLEAVRELTQEMTKYGIAAKETFELANIAAQSGARGADLMAQTRQATRLAVLGQMEQQEAVKTTITLQNAFQLSNEELADSINFLNIVENQSVLSLQDVAGAIPRVAPVVKSLGGDVRDLSVMLVAMREGGVSAAEGANALKTSLARLISPTAGASKMAKELGINLNGIVEANQGDILGAVLQLAGAMEELDELSQQRLLSEIFGKRQYARVGALFNNITNEASQAQRVLDLTTMSTEDLAATADKELGAVEQSISTKFTAAVELLKTEIAPIGEQFLKLATPIVQAVGSILSKFNDLSPTVKNFAAILTAGIGVVVPIVLMLVGLFGNLLGNLAKGIATLSGFFARIRNGSEAVQYLAGNQLEAEAAAASLEGRTTKLTGSLNVQREAVEALTRAYGQYVAGANAAVSSLPQGFRTPTGPAVAPTGMATGGMVGGVGNKDTEPALLTPGEFVINADASKKFAPLLSAINEGKVGKYADGRTQFSVGGRSFNVNLQDQRSLRAVQSRLESAFDMGATEFEQLASIVDNFGDTLISSVKDIDAKIKQAGGSLVEVLPKSATETKYSYPGSESMEESLTRIGVPSAQIEKELETANISARGAVNAVDENADLLRSLGYSQEQLAVEAGIARSHMQQVDKSLGLEAWEPDFWIAQSQAENQFLNTIKGSTRNQEMLETYLVQQLDSAQDAKALMQKIKSGVGLTEDEFEMLNQGLTAMLNDVKSSTTKAAQIKKATSEKFILGAVSTTGASAARKAAGVGYDVGRIAGGGTISGLEDVTGSNSESREAQRVANDVVDGFANQMERRAAETYRSGQILGERAVEGVKSGSSDIRVVLKDMGLGPLAQKEQQEIKETIALRKKENKELLKRAQLLAIRGYAPDVARRKAAEQMAAESAAAAKPAATPGAAGKDRFGLQYATKSVQDDLDRATKKATDGLDDAGTQSAQTAKKVGKLRGGITKFGGALKNGSMKMQGAFFALDGLVFAASMMNNSFGELAQKALPLVFGLQGLTMLTPMLESRLFKFAAPLAASAAAIWFLKSKADEMSQEVSNMSESLVATRKTIDKVGEFFGNQSIVAQQEALELEEQTGIKDEDLEKAREFLETDVGKQISEGLATAVQDFGSSTAGTQFANNLASMVLQGVMSPEQAKAVALQVGEQMQDRVFALRVNGQLNQLMGPNNKNLLESPLELAANISMSGAKTVSEVSENVEQLGSQMQGFNEFTAGDLGASFIPVFGAINLINKATLDWDNSIGRVARSARGILNLDNYEDVERSLMSVGNVVGNQLVQSYANLDAATTRYEQAVEQASKEEGKAKDRAIKNAKEAKEAEDLLRDSIKKQEEDYRSMFSTLDGAARVTVLEGMRTSLSEQFSDNPALKMAYDVLAGRLKGVSQDIQFNINMALASGQLNPQAAQFLFNQLGNDEQASQVLNLAVQNSGVDEVNERLINLFNMSDEDLQREAMMIFETSYTGERTEEEKQRLKGLENDLNNANRAYQQFVDNQSYAANASSENASEIGTYQEKLNEAQQTLASIEADLRDYYEMQGLQGEQLQEAIKNDEDYQQALENTEVWQSKLTKAISESTDTSEKNAEFRKEEKRLLGEVKEAQKAYNEEKAKEPDTPEVAAAKEEFLVLKDAIQQTEGMRIEFDTEGMSLSAIQEANRNLAMLQNFPPEVRKIVDLDVISDPDALDEALEGYLLLQSQDPEVVLDAMVNVAKAGGGDEDDITDALEAINMEIDEFAAKDDQFKTAVMATVQARITLDIEIDNLEDLLDSSALGPVGTQAAEGILANKRAEIEQLKELLQGFADLDSGAGGDDGDDGDGGGAGGGEREKTFLEQLQADLDANSILYLNAKKGLEGYAKNRGNFFGAFQKLRKIGVPEALISALGTGPEAVKKARELLALGKDQLNELIKDFETVSVGEVVENARRKAIEQEEELQARRKAKRLNIDPELQDIILADKELTRSFATVKEGTPEYERLMKVVRRLARAKKNLAEATATEADKQKEAIDAIDEARQPLLDEFARREALFRQEFGRIEREWQPIIEANEEQIDLLQEQIDSVQEEIDAIERLNEADERRIRGLERQKEMLGRQIEAIERQNEMDQRRIEELNREDEMRGRVADQLQRELEFLSDQEEKIKETYEERVDALDKVAQVNDYIISQQKQQLGLSQAISEGDIYAATQAAQQMRAESAQFATQSARAGLEKGMETQIANLRTESGLTREETEERIKDIQEQSYQVSLQIREIEDLIYQRNLDMIPLKDQQYTLDQQIQGIQDIIYNRETQILDIETRRLQPLEDQLTAQQKSLSNNQQALADAKAAVRIEGQTYDELQNQISAEKEAYDVAVAQIRVADDVKNSVENIRKKWVDVTKQIAAAVRQAKQLKEKAEIVMSSDFDIIDADAAAGRITPDTAEQRKADARAARDEAIAGIFAARDAEISAALISGTESLRMAKGGMIKGYRGGGVVSGMQSLAVGGNVVGAGSMDSIPAMLTPGEFVIRKAMVDKYGTPFFDAVNQGAFSVPRYSVPETGDSTVVAPINNMTSVNAPVYNNYDMKFSINGTNQNPDEIANQVMFKMRQLQNQGVRGNRGY